MQKRKGRMGNMKKYILNKRKSIIAGIVGIICIWGILVFMKHNDWIYPKQIAQINEVSEQLLMEYDANNGGKEQSYEETISAVLTNGEHKNRKIILTNQWSTSEISDRQYKVGDKIFVSEMNSTVGEYTVQGVKRDYAVVLVFVVLLWLLIMVGGKKGALSLVSLVFNIGLSYFIVVAFMESKHIWIVSIAITILYAIISLPLASGFNKKTFAAIVATLSGTFLTVALSLGIIILNNDRGLPYSLVGFLTIIDERKIFLIGVMLGALGAIMDISITMCSSINELCQNDENLSVKTLINSGIAIGKDIIGTMVNVLFFTYLAGSIPLMILWVNTDIALDTMVNQYLSLEITRVLTGSISIVLSIPIALATAILIFRKKEVPENEY